MFRNYEVLAFQSGLPELSLVPKSKLRAVKSLDTMYACANLFTVREHLSAVERAECLNFEPHELFLKKQMEQHVLTLSQSEDVLKNVTNVLSSLKGTTKDC